MTKQWIKNIEEKTGLKSTEFGLWLRRQEKIKSEDGFVATNLDYVWHNYETGLWMIIEEKR